MATDIHKTYKYRQARRLMFALYGDRCHYCGHSGAREADHITPAADDPTQPADPEMLRPIHGTSSPCPVCLGASGRPRCCNQERGKKPLGANFRPQRDW